MEEKKHSAPTYAHRLLAQPHYTYKYTSIQIPSDSASQTHTHHMIAHNHQNTSAHTEWGHRKNQWQRCRRRWWPKRRYSADVPGTDRCTATVSRRKRCKISKATLLQPLKTKCQRTRTRRHRGTPYHPTYVFVNQEKGEEKWHKHLPTQIAHRHTFMKNTSIPHVAPIAPREYIKNAIRGANN